MSREGNGCKYWDCKKVRGKECKARAITKTLDGLVTVTKGPNESKHTHPPYQEEWEAEMIKKSIKNQAAEAHVPPTAILRGF